MRISWVHPDVVTVARNALLAAGASWDDLFENDTLRPVPAPTGQSVEEWPRLAAHVARAERVRAAVEKEGLPAAQARFGASPWAVERAVLVEASDGDDFEQIAGVLACPIDDLVAYGHFLSRLVELGVPKDPAATVSAYEAFVAAAQVLASHEPSWPERVRVARDGLASLYVRVGRSDDADSVYRERYAEEPGDMTVAIGAARAFLEAGDTLRAVAWLDRGRGRAEALGRDELAAQLQKKMVSLRARLN